jgi:hypothetical protein
MTKWRLSLATLGIGALVLLGLELSAQAAGPTRPLRPRFHIDRYGRLIEDVCAETFAGQKRCYAHRILHGDKASLVQAARKPRPAGPGSGTANDPNCQPEGFGGGGNSPPQGSMTPTDVIAAYDIPSSSSAKGKIVALIELPSVNAFADVNSYRQAFNIPQLPACPTDSNGVPTPNGTACFARVGEDGTVNSVGNVDCPGWAGETGLDMDMVSAACPDCSIVLVEANVTNDLSQMNKVAATTLKPAAVSNSWGGPEQGPGQDDQTPFDNSTTLELVASGDEGYMDEDDNNGQIAGSDFPSSSPYVIAVGGTTLTGGMGTAYSVVVWNDDAAIRPGAGAGGSGCSVEFGMPSYQSKSGFNFGSCPSNRASVDMAAAAEFNPPGQGPDGSEGGIAEFDSDDQGWNAEVGTSAACPMVAAIMTRIGLAGKDNHDLFYKNISSFHDITMGTNDNDNLCSDVMCTAGTGWDGPSGLGTPDGTKLAKLAPKPASPPTPDAGAGGDADADDAATPEGNEDGGAAGPSSGSGSGGGTGNFGGGGSGGGGGQGGGGTPDDDNSGGFQGAPAGGVGMVAQPGGGGHGSSGCSISRRGSDAPDWLSVGLAGMGLAAFASRLRRPRRRTGRADTHHAA